MADQLTQSAETVAGFLQSFTSYGGLRLRFRVKARGAAMANEASESASAVPPGAIVVEFTGPDTPLLTARNGEVLNALEHVAAQILRLPPDQHDRISFDADRFKVNRDLQLRRMATEAVERVTATGRPYSFPGMTSRERRMLHLILKESGLPTASSGEGPGRFVVL